MLSHLYNYIHNISPFYPMLTQSQFENNGGCDTWIVVLLLISWFDKLLSNHYRTQYDNKQSLGGKLGPKGLGRGGIYAMYSTKGTIWLRQKQGYLSAQASTDRKAGRFSLPFYSIEFFGTNTKIIWFVFLMYSWSTLFD